MKVKVSEQAIVTGPFPQQLFREGHLTNSLVGSHKLDLPVKGIVNNFPMLKNSSGLNVTN